jgi:hypothetical protein
MTKYSQTNHWLHPFILVLMTETPKTESDCYLILYSVIVYFMFKEKITFQWSSMNQIFATYSLQLFNGIWKSFKIHAIYQWFSSFFLNISFHFLNFEISKCCRFRDSNDKIQSNMYIMATQWNMKICPEWIDTVKFRSVYWSSMSIGHFWI